MADRGSGDRRLTRRSNWLVLDLGQTRSRGSKWLVSPMPAAYLPAVSQLMPSSRAIRRLDQPLALNSRPDFVRVNSRSHRNFYAFRNSQSALWLTIQIVICPFIKMPSQQYRRFVLGDVFGETIPLLLDRDYAPGGIFCDS